RFLIVDCPTTTTLPKYLREFAKFGVTDVVRVCEPTYPAELVEAVGIHVHDLPFPDGGIPPPAVLKAWLGLLLQANLKSHSSSSSSSSTQCLPTIAIHCVAGLGRAPVMVAIALIERGLDPLDTIELVRKHRRGAFNSKQVSYLAEYKR
ncbi:MAG: protein-tyrosine phosphatase-like protein, partial [Piptocephalis tieghemiana]